MRDAGGRIVATYLWDGLWCLGRIDGPPGAPLAAAFSLDPTGTPVRVVTAAGVEVIPRDAYGEALLGRRGLPGLFGGAVHQSLVHLPARALDPRTGAFVAPDPFAGGDADPRRGDGFRGPLPVDDPACGPYAVAAHDPVGRADPAGASSAAVHFLMTLSDVTWNWCNNTLGWLGLDLFVNFWGSLFSSIGSWSTGPLGRFFDYEAVAGDRLSAWGIRRDGVTVKGSDDTAWTYGHLVMASSKFLADLERPRVFAPDAPFRPMLYGTVLAVVPSSGANTRGRSRSARNFDDAITRWP